MLTPEATTALQEFMTNQLPENRELLEKAVFLSIKVWEQKLVSIYPTFGNCPLCFCSLKIGKSLLGKIYLDSKEMCIYCPLDVIGNRCNTQNSSYKAVMNADIDARHYRMQEMLQLLKDIRDVINQMSVDSILGVPFTRSQLELIPLSKDPKTELMAFSKNIREIIEGEIIEGEINK